MIARLTGTVSKSSPGEAVMDVSGVGYRVRMPIDVWERLRDSEEVTLHITTYVREDRLDLFGFNDVSSRTLFEELIRMTGIGTSLGLELCAVPRGLLLQAINEKDASVLTRIKGIGKKRADKLLVDLQSLIEKHPSLFAGTVGEASRAAAFDADAIAALAALGYDNSTIMRALKNLPADLKSTEDRVSAALRSL